MGTPTQRLILALRADQRAQTKSNQTRERLKQAVINVCDNGMTEYECVDITGFSRATIREWRGKKPRERRTK